MNDWLAAEFGGHLTQWERERISAANMAYVFLLCDATGASLFPILDDPEGVPDEFGCRDGIDAIIFGSGEGTRREFEVGLWALERMGLAKLANREWNLTPAGGDAAVAVVAYAHLLKEQDRRLPLTVLQGGAPR